MLTTVENVNRGQEIARVPGVQKLGDIRTHKTFQSGGGCRNPPGSVLAPKKSVETQIGGNVSLATLFNSEPGIACRQN